ncbi:MAG TPA: M48 family metalloprotease [Pyrinomonadaceae bacterium]|jgi:hypothetical protein
MNTSTLNHLRRLTALALVALALASFNAPSRASAIAGDDAELREVLDAIGQGSAVERLRRVTRGRAGWPTEAQAAEEFKILRASEVFAPLRSLGHSEGGDEVARVRRVLAPLFELHGGSTLVVSVLHTPQVVHGIGRGSVLLVSTGLLQVVSDEELLALSAHEIGHQYFRREFARAEDAGDKRALRLIEFKCDAIAALSLLVLNAEPDALARGLDWVKGPAYSAVSGDTHPDLKLRKQLIARLGT